MRYFKIQRQPTGKLGIVVTSYLNNDERRFSALMSLLWGFKAQSYSNWLVKIVHDGPMTNAGHEKLLRDFDPKVELTIRPRLEQYGHPHRRPAGLEPFHADGQEVYPDFLMFTNDDNWYAPATFEYMLGEGERMGADLIVCNMIHSHKWWQPLPVEMKVGRVDIGSFIASRALVERTDWSDFSFRGDGQFACDLHTNSTRSVKLPSYLFVHN